MEFPDCIAPPDRVLLAVRASRISRPNMTYIANILGVTRQTVAFHVVRLVDDGLIRNRKTGQHWVELTDNGERRAEHIASTLLRNN